MIALLAAAPAVPLNSTAGRYVAAAYIVVLLVILIYVAIMAVRAQRLERELDELRRDVEAARAAREPGSDEDPVLERESV
jgi:CcmD family protein